MAGLAATAAMTPLILMAPFIGMPAMDVGGMLGDFLGTTATVGWVMHFVIGSLLALVYAAAFVQWLPGSPAVRGALYGALVFFVAQLVAMPIMGGAIFSGGDGMMILGSLIGHVVYGGVLGAFYGFSAPIEGQSVTVEPPLNIREPEHAHRH
ncbi:MAG: DUF1440 domain-containing protein [Gemmatimonadetes bacterium]|nr:DUF1440 domain-containing protein [Gemmatimonadota bacterium]